MKILSWNINGIRASKINLKQLFDSLDADVICLQETKVTRDMLDEPSAIVEGYNSYFSYSRKRSGYSGVASFCKDHITPFRAEEGLAGAFTTADEGTIGCYGNQTSFTGDELKDLDAEGRAVITVHRISDQEGKTVDLAIINVYCPRFDPEREDRHLYKLRFNALLQTRAEALLDDGYHVIILGDINTTHKDIDRCDPEDEASVKMPSRLWMNHMIWEEGRDISLDDVIDREEFAAATPYTKGGKFIDTYRHLYPDKEGAYTCWCTLTNARSTNFGRRLDYILGDVHLVSSFLKDAVIMQDIEGSDHCPIKIELNCKVIPSQKCPPLCTKFNPEFQGKQQKLSNFFTKMKKDDSLSGSQKENSDQESKYPLKTNTIKSIDCLEEKSRTFFAKRPLEKSESSDKGIKKQKTLDMKKTSSGGKQSSLMGFFSKSQKSASKTGVSRANEKEQSENGKIIQLDGSISSCVTTLDKSDSYDKIESTENASQGDTKKSINTVNGTSKQAASAWKSLLGGLGPAPLCKGHSEPCVLRMVKKPGPNKGKQFYTCARGEGLKSNPEARCDFFKWVEKKKTS